MTTNNIEMQDTMGNVLYPHTSGDIVQYDSTKTVNEKIDEVIADLTTLKAGLTATVNDKAGSSLTSDSSLADITSKINEIVTLSSGTSDATATAANILSGQTAYSKGSKITGTMTNNGAVTSNINCGASYTIPAGYHSGSGKVTGNSLTSQTSATVVANDMLSGKTAYVNGSKITGTMSTMTIAGSGSDGINYHTNALDAACGAHSSGDTTQYVYLGMPQWTYTGQNNWLRYPASTVANKMGLTADKIIAGNTIGGISGTATASKNVATLTLTDINLVTTTADGSGLRFSVDLSAYLNGLSSYIVECSGTCYAYSTSTVASYAVVTPYSSFIKYKDSYAGDTFKVEVPDPTKIVFYRRTNSTYKCTSINFTVRITSF